MLPKLIKNSEDRFKSYKQLLESVYKDTEFDKESDFYIWYIKYLREMKNMEESWLKELIDEKTNYNGGLNPPFCYKWKKS
jgi:hypothetical protein